MKKLLLTLFAAVLLISCNSVKPVPVINNNTDNKTEQTEKHDSDKQQRDSIIIKDSIIVKIQNDTTYIDRWRTQYKEKIVIDYKIDSIYLYNTDSIYIEKPVYIERPLTFAEKFKASFGLSVAWLIVILIIYAVIKTK